MADLYKLYDKNYKKRIRISLLKNTEIHIKSGHFKKREANININSKFLIGFIFFILTFSIIPTFYISTHSNTPKQFQPDKSEFISTHSFHPDANNNEHKDNNVEDQSFTEDKEIVLVQEEQELNQQNLLGVSEIKLLKSNEEEIELEFSLSELIIENITAPTGELYKKLSIVDGGCLANIGKPELPTKGIYLDVPVGAKLELQIKSLTFHEENGYNIYPYQPSQIDCENNEIPFEKNISAYQINSFYPTKIASIMDVGVIRGHITALLMICPVLYNPYLKKIRLHTKINIQVKFNLDDSDLLKETSLISKKEKYNSEAFQFLFENIYLNYQSPLDSRDDIKFLNRDSIDADGADYLVITADQFYDNVLPLAQSKELKGLATVVVKLSEIGTSPSADDISAYIQNAYNTWDPAPSYLLLVGDSNILPVHYKEDMVASDLYYATVDGTDYFPDIFVGRLPVQNNNELDIIINKIINYEANLNPLDFWRNKVLLASYEESGRFFTITSEAIRQYLEAEGYIC
ncbi:MAG: C25 family cysteine peptidase, partial [Promethearchaeota archaeon]